MPTFNVEGAVRIFEEVTEAVPMANVAIKHSKLARAATTRRERGQHERTMLGAIALTTIEILRITRGMRNKSRVA